MIYNQLLTRVSGCNWFFNKTQKKKYPQFLILQNIQRRIINYTR